MENFAFIDGQNLNLGVVSQGWKLDFRKFRVYLKEKYKVTKAYLFIGYIESNSDLYSSLNEYGYICIFKKVQTVQGIIKGNVDAELVLHTVININLYDKAIIITGDGDFYCLVDYLIDNSKLECLIVPNKYQYSSFYKDSKIARNIRNMNDLRIRLSK